MFMLLSEKIETNMGTKSHVYKIIRLRLQGVSFEKNIRSLFRVCQKGIFYVSDHIK